MAMHQRTNPLPVASLCEEPVDPVQYVQSSICPAISHASGIVNMAAVGATDALWSFKPLCQVALNQFQHSIICSRQIDQPAQGGVG